MLNKDSLYLFLYAIPVYQLLFYIIQLATVRKANPSRYYMGLLLLNMAAVLVLNTFHCLGYFSLFSTFFIFFIPLILALLPTFFLYVYALFKNHTINKASYFIMFIPALLVLVFNIIFIRNLTDYQKFLYVPFSEALEAEPMIILEIVFLRLLLPAMLVAQVILAFIKVHKFMKAEDNLTSIVAVRSDLAARTWMYITMACVVVLISVIVFEFVTVKNQNLYYAIFINLTLIISTGLVGYFGLSQNKLIIKSISQKQQHIETFEAENEGFVGTESLEELQQDKSFDEVTPLMSKDEANEIIQLLETLMREQKPFLDPKYSMKDLCEQINVDRRKISYVLNNEMEKNFYGVLNEHRMQHAIYHIENDGEKYTIEAIAQMVGFNSKSSFYTCFKKYTGLTPTEYLLHKNSKE